MIPANPRRTFSPLSYFTNAQLSQLPDHAALGGKSDRGRRTGLVHGAIRDSKDVNETKHLSSNERKNKENVVVMWFHKNEKANRAYTS